MLNDRRHNKDISILFWDIRIFLITVMFYHNEFIKEMKFQLQKRKHYNFRVN